jgi:hypothetical protein
MDLFELLTLIALFRLCIDRGAGGFLSWEAVAEEDEGWGGG